MKINCKHIISLVLVMLLLTGVFLVSSADMHKNVSDIDNHWAEETLNAWVDNNFLVGYEEGVYNPDEKLTRAQFISFINRLFDFQNEKEHQFNDVNEGSWYENEVKKSIANGYIVGFSDNTFRPDSIITRIEAAAVLSRLVDLEENLNALDRFDDYEEIPAWGINSVSAVIDAGLMSDFLDQTFGAGEEITRAQAIVALQNAKDLLEEDVISELVIAEAGIYGPEEGEVTYTNVYINSPDVTLQNVVVLEDLIIGEEVGDGDVTLNNVKVVNGTLIIKGGGTDSIKINGGQYNSIRIENTPTGGIRVVATGVVDKDGNTVDIVISENIDGRKVILEGDFDEVVVESTHVSIDTLGNTNINKLTVKENSRFVKITTSDDTNINSLDNESNSLIRVRGDGNVESDTGKVTYGDPTPTKTTPEKVLVADISITASSISIDENGGTLQMTAAVLPENADNKEVTWAIRTNQDDGNETGYASISEDGLLTAVADGTVKVIATADDSSGVTGEVTITISNQAPEIDGAEVTIREGSIYFQYSFKQGNLVVDYKLAQNVYGLSTTDSTVWLERVVDSETSITTAAITLDAAGVDPESGRVTYSNGLSEVNDVFGVDFIDWGGPPTYVHLDLSDGNTWNESFSIELQEEDKQAFLSLIPEEVTVTGISVKTAPDKTVYTEGDTLDLTGLVVTLAKSDDSDMDVTFASFRDNNVYTIKGHGDQLSTTDTAIEIIHSVSEESTSQPITVNSQGPILVSDLSITPSSIEIALGEEVELELIVTPVDANNQAVEWSVSEDNIIALEPITGGAIVTGTSPGAITVTATAQDGSNETSQCTVTVTEMPLEPLVSITTGSAVFTYDFEYDGETIGYLGAISEYGLNTTGSSVQIINGNGNESGEAYFNSFSFNGDGVVEYGDPSSLFTSFGMTPIDFSGWDPLNPTAMIFRLNGTIDGIIPWEFDITVPLEESDIQVFMDFVTPN